MSALKTQFQAALDRSDAAHVTAHIIPPITNSLGRHWKQPSRFDIEIDAEHALMTKVVFDELAEYSSTLPTGVYEGKMWRRKLREDKWLLAWYGPCDKPGHCSINTRKILLL